VQQASTGLGATHQQASKFFLSRDQSFCHSLVSFVNHQIGVVNLIPIRPADLK